MTGVILFST